VRKLLNNFGPAALRVLGLPGYAAMVATAALQAPEIARRRSLSPLDRAFAKDLRLAYRGQRYRLDCGAVDRAVPEDSYVFGAVRELFVRDCYFRGLDLQTPLGVVVDLGANRGVFSLLASKLAKRVLSVECQAKYNAAFDAVFAHEARGHVTLANCFVGNAATLSPTDGDASTVSLTQLLDMHQIQQVDLLKVDIEGSEFGLIEDLEGLARVKALVMEVHPKYGDPAQLVSALKAAGFRIDCADADLKRCAPAQADFVYGVRQASVPTSA